jgi:uncharacterized protein YjiS (DUF1127 family)
MLNVLDTWRRNRRVRQTRVQLAQLSDHLLADIGISRSDIYTNNGKLAGRINREWDR